jgi:prevent-host-death family protein
MKNTWALQDAKNRFSEVVETALHCGPQHVSRRGKPAVVVLSEKDYQRLTRGASSLAEFFAGSPLRGLDLTRSKDLPRNVKL